MRINLLMVLFLVGCTVNSIVPGGGGMEMDLDISANNFRHGWGYFSKPIGTETIVRDEASIERGRELFIHHCQKCHGPDGSGKGPLAEALKLEPANLTNVPKNMDRTYIIAQVKDGKGSMPMWRDILTNTQVKDLSNYIKELSRK